MEKRMYALTFCYMGADNDDPFATTIAVSDSRQRLTEEMLKCVGHDTCIDEDDEWNDDCNFMVVRTNPGVEVILQHRKRINLYSEYKIQSVKIV